STGSSSRTVVRCGSDPFPAPRPRPSSLRAATTRASENDGRKMSRLGNQEDYDRFAGGDERERHPPHHRMLDDLEVELVERYAAGKHALEVGCGTGLILERVARFAASARGIDLSPGMLEKARARGLDVAQASATELPYETASVDVAYS